MSNALVITPMKSLNVKNFKIFARYVRLEPSSPMQKYLKQEMPLAVIGSRSEA